MHIQNQCMEDSFLQELREKYDLHELQIYVYIDSDGIIDQTKAISFKSLSEWNHDTELVFYAGLDSISDFERVKNIVLKEIQNEDLVLEEKYIEKLRNYAASRPVYFTFEYGVEAHMRSRDKNSTFYPERIAYEKGCQDCLNWWLISQLYKSPSLMTEISSPSVDLTPVSALILDRYPARWWLMDEDNNYYNLEQYNSDKEITCEMYNAAVIYNVLVYIYGEWRVNQALRYNKKMVVSAELDDKGIPVTLQIEANPDKFADYQNRVPEFMREFNEWFKRCGDTSEICVSLPDDLRRFLSYDPMYYDWALKREYVYPEDKRFMVGEAKERILYPVNELRDIVTNLLRRVVTEELNLKE